MTDEKKTPTMPGGALSKRPLHFIWIVDCSGSMNSSGKIQSLNNAIRESIPEMKNAALNNPNAELLIRVVKFSTGAQWHISNATNIKDFKWDDLQADGETDMGRAFTLVADALKMPPMPERALPPVLVLLSDGQPTDDYGTGLKKLLEEPWGKRAVRISIAIGNDADINVLQKFIPGERKPLMAHNAETLINYVRWASTAIIKNNSNPITSNNESPSVRSNIPEPPPEEINVPNVW